MVCLCPQAATPATPGLYSSQLLQYVGVVCLCPQAATPATPGLYSSQLLQYVGVVCLCPQAATPTAPGPYSSQLLQYVGVVCLCPQPAMPSPLTSCEVGDVLLLHTRHSLVADDEGATHPATVARQEAGIILHRGQGPAGACTRMLALFVVCGEAVPC